MKTMSIRELQLKELEILKDFDMFCRKHNLKYCLATGTLLGAVRHKGFIPWDDDIDVHMPRPDYIKFNQIYDSRYTLKSPLIDKKWHLPFAKLMNTNIKIKESGVSISTGIWIDIFPIDGWPLLHKDSVGYHKKQQLLQKFATWHNIQFLKSRHGYVRTVGKFLILGIIRFLPRGWLARYIDSKAAHKYLYVYAEFVGNTVWPDRNLVRYKKEYFDDVMEIQFEDSDFYVPVDYGDYLTQLYGDYTQLPPISERVTHNIQIL